MNFISQMKLIARNYTRFPNEHRSFIHLNQSQILVVTYDNKKYVWTLNEDVITEDEAEALIVKNEPSPLSFGIDNNPSSYNYR